MLLSTEHKKDTKQKPHSRGTQASVLGPARILWGRGMSRGRRPLMALRKAMLIAKKRGETQQCMHGPGTLCNFVIYCLAFVALVRIKRVTRIHRLPCMDRAGGGRCSRRSFRAIASIHGISRGLLGLPATREGPGSSALRTPGSSDSSRDGSGGAGKVQDRQYRHNRPGPGQGSHYSRPHQHNRYGFTPTVQAFKLGTLRRRKTLQKRVRVTVNRPPHKIPL